jgi:hypothetical protein
MRGRIHRAFIILRESIESEIKRLSLGNEATWKVRHFQPEKWGCVMSKQWNWKRVIGFVGCAVTAAGWAASPIQWRGSAGWEPESAYCRLYDAKRVETLKGTVQRVEKVVPMKGMGEGVHLILKTDKEMIPVQLGPVWFVEKQALQLHAQDVVEVTGSRVSCDGKPAILAALIKRGMETAKFRELKGSPAWAGVAH